jgi:hypothetical protein
MPFPVSRTITIAIDARDREDELFSEIERGLSSLGAVDLRREAGLLSFRVPWTTSYGPLFMVTRGSIGILPSEGAESTTSLSCYLSFRRAAISVIVLSYGWLGVGASLMEGGYSGGSLVGTLIFCTAGWCCLLGLWYLIIPSWLFRRLKLQRFEAAPLTPAA